MDGLVEGLFILIVIVGSIVQSAVAQKKKKEQQREMERRRAAEQSGLPKGEPASARRAAEEEEDSSEELIPTVIWEEIAELAGARPPSRPAPEPAPTPGPPTTLEPGRRPAEARYEPRERSKTPEPGLRTPPAPAPTPRETTSLPERSRRLAAELGEERSSTPAPDLQLEVMEGEDSKRLEWLFGGTDPAALRRAILLREVLGPPLALREEEES